MSYPLLSIQKIATDPIVSFPCYFVMSTAPINIEDTCKGLAETATEEESADCLTEITAHLKRNHPNSELLVMVHGYNTGLDGVQYWSREAAKEIARRYPQTPKGLILIVYRWPSEQMSGDESGDVKAKRISARQALPRIINYVYHMAMAGAIVGVVGSCIGYGLLVWKGVSWLAVLVLFSSLFTVAMVVFAPLGTIFVLRISNYFRDTFRANQYGASDLVELIRQLDDALVDQVLNPDRHAREKYWENHRIRMSFIGHSMGAFVVTNAVRVLSDVFDRASIRRIGTRRSHVPSSKVGNVFALSRLVLVAPDISSETIISGRANVLQSSLRRFEEAYLFCNEGDMALRLASTTANYFSFPARTRDGGYRLGSVTVREARAVGNLKIAGIANLLPNGDLVRETVREFLSYLYIRRSRSLLDHQLEIGLDEGVRPIAELFTYFDCTNYCEKRTNTKTHKLENTGILTRAENKVSLGMGDYASLCKDMAQGKRDPHGGYIFSEDADFTKQAIYGLACLGWSEFLDTLNTETLNTDPLEPGYQPQPIRSDLTPIAQQKLARLFTLHNLCNRKGVKVLLSPERYDVDILQKKFDRSVY